MKNLYPGNCVLISSLYIDLIIARKNKIEYHTLFCEKHSIDSVYLETLSSIAINSHQKQGNVKIL